MHGRSRQVMVLGGVSAAAALVFAANGQRAGRTPADYWMTAETTSGIGAMMGGRSTRDMMSAMLGRGGGGARFAHTLRLQLGSQQRPSSEPAAEHLPPAALAVGPSLPLVSPHRDQASERPEPGSPGHYERPRGRILIFWGCGEHARSGQPAIIDFATLTAGKAAPLFRGVSLHQATAPSPARFASYGEWPNARLARDVPPTGSLVGEHVVRGNYSPELRFTIGPAQDFLGPVRLGASATAASGATSGASPITWQPIGTAQGWFVSTIGGSASGDMVMWNSSEVQTADLSADFIAGADAARLVQQRVLLPGSADRCTVPAEVIAAAPQAMLSITAYGSEANWSYPPRPPRAPAGWQPDWTAKLRTKSTYRGMLGMAMPEMDVEGAAAGDRDRPAAKKRKRSIFDKLDNLVPR